MEIVRSTLKGAGFDHFYRGKVRDVYHNNKKILVVATDRISAFDHILPRPIPYKGQVLNQLSAYFLRECSDIVDNWLETVPDPNVSIGKYCKPIPIEVVVRGYLTGHAWRVYKGGGRELCGVPLPEGMNKNDRFPSPIITPATKAENGHDVDISSEEIIAQGILSPSTWERIVSSSLALYERGCEMAEARELVLVDTKYEYGRIGEEVYLIDEIHTPDSSRYFYKKGYQKAQDNGLPQIQLSKEFVREWLMENGFQGKENQPMPYMPDAFVTEVSQKYIDLYEQLTGHIFEYPDPHPPTEIRISENIMGYLRP